MENVVSHKRSREQAEPCPNCRLSYQCICEQIPSILSGQEIFLLTHPNETERATNTGRLVLDCLANSYFCLWQRKQIPEILAQRLQDMAYKCILVYPSPDAVTIDEILQETLSLETKAPSQELKIAWIILDATWQEAKKIYNKSPWLQALPQVKFTPEKDSNYNLRRNQASGNLCTCEIVSHLLDQVGENQNALELDAYMQTYLKHFQADRSGHQLKT